MLTISKIHITFRVLFVSNILISEEKNDFYESLWSYLQHGQQVAEGGAENPVVDQQHRQRNGQHDEALDDVAERQVDHQSVQRLASPLAHQRNYHGRVGQCPDQRQQQVQRHEQRVDGLHREPKVRLLQTKNQTHANCRSVFPRNQDYC